MRAAPSGLRVVRSERDMRRVEMDRFARVSCALRTMRVGPRTAVAGATVGPPVESQREREEKEEHALLF